MAIKTLHGVDAEFILAQRESIFNEVYRINTKLGRTVGRRKSIAALVDQCAFLAPWHHGAQALADLFDWVLGGSATQGLEASLSGTVLKYPLLSEPARLDVVQDGLHLVFHSIIDQHGTAGQVTVFGCVGD